MEGFKIRMKVEYSQLKSRVDSLDLFVTKQSKEQTVSDDELTILHNQLISMQNYLSYLKQRCIMHDVEI